MDINNIRIAVIGLGYVGLPLMVEFAKKYPTLGFDINSERISAKRRHRFDERSKQERIKGISSWQFLSRPS